MSRLVAFCLSVLFLCLPAAAEKRLLVHEGPAMVFEDYNEMAAKLDDPNIVRVYDIDNDGKTHWESNGPSNLCVCIEFLALCMQILESLPRGHAALADQLRRAAMSIPLNIAEAEGRTGGADKARTYAIARGSAMECAAILDVCKTLRLVEEPAYQRGDELLGRAVSMLTKLCR